MDDLRAQGKSETEVVSIAKRFLMKKTTMFTAKHLVQAGEKPDYDVFDAAQEQEAKVNGEF